MSFAYSDERDSNIKMSRIIVRSLENNPQEQSSRLVGK